MTIKARRRLKNFNFEEEGSHVALVGKHQGGPANGYKTLITKSTKGIPISFVEKADMVNVTMTIQEFLRRFFGLYYEDAGVLARILGYETEMTEDQMVDSYEEFIQSQIDSVEIMKSLFKAEDMTKALSEVSEKQFDTLLQDQLLIEKALSSSTDDKKLPKQNEKPKEDLTKMSEKTTDMIQKADLESHIEKAVAPLRVELTKANEDLEAYKAREKEQKAGTRKAALEDAVKDVEKAEVLFKSFEDLSDESFSSTIETLKAMNTATEASEMFVEKGADAEGEDVTSDQGKATRDFLESRFPKK
jgi:hypothetical protein